MKLTGLLLLSVATLPSVAETMRCSDGTPVGMGRCTGQQLSAGVDLYATARSAQWQSVTGRVRFGSARVAKRAMAQGLGSVRLANGRWGRQVIAVRPDWRGRDYVGGRFDLPRLPENAHLRAELALMHGAPDRATLRYSVLAIVDGSERLLKQQQLSGKRVIRLDVDLSPWRGRALQLELRVERLFGSYPVTALWITPRIEAKE
ncbi:hypothetical protein BOW53_15475 [Solemya pervernicosa gill symbiont]|uniref:Uncharacterized protein n=2 Tax=Gammaproteobacteria incertae sedis TaxID=118884 RepID=A0A1T2L0E1_9GAMM|nr:hypothetical protein BOW53_15475 [Solemya pervernicosa gill symbiont]